MERIEMDMDIMMNEQIRMSSVQSVPAQKNEADDMRKLLMQREMLRD